MASSVCLSLPNKPADYHLFVPTFLCTVWNRTFSLFQCLELRSRASTAFAHSGYIPSPIVVSDIHYTNVVEYPSGFWMFPSTIVKIGGKLYSRSPNNFAIADTGTTLIKVDRDLLNAIYSPLRGFTASDGLLYFPVSSH